MGRKSVTPQVVEYLTEHPNEIVHRAKMAKELKLTPEQIRGAMYGLKWSAPQVWRHVEVITKANSWKYTPEVVQQSDDDIAASERFVKVGVRRNGTVLLEDEDGSIWVASPLSDQ